MAPDQTSVKGQLIVLTGPSGVGKGTLVQLLLERQPHWFLSISATTRSPRAGEVDGQSYYFLTKEEFQTWIGEEKLLEWAEYAGNYYGTPRQPVEEQIAQGKTVLLEIEVLGARQIKQTFPSARRIFILPPSVEVLEERLRGRGSDSETAIAKRLAQAQQELQAAAEFDYQVVNDDLDQALHRLVKLIGEEE
ncbi:guanylate kinase [Synechocystis sp. PCC 6803]|uniref:Guanylate kinase n=1 Tax=Synechocystis sp. (strain ATCC 27184 / PCC 6803 / Kazusa) TaxID=1111708 RepID=KGUA_SYNY3|nr:MULTISPECIES: guanylate kinase [unclassified Synechocystis]P72648.1 RecName: Full=Guanylate kinase; AltName: Full=GMP kinase [Synechocystis sp. PCC 6803 substr. Kazusa]BAM50351.1 guanylate kinase [Synechocystis sp. PCC 6803] [Bacillus subtilis BEST7613]AGF50339.1 guanylate kinase [Synechocystis sp. PCC 6803]ALJ66434.1 guanylate kinase [Synechocystis sp. PCC 6803]AVP88283.1 guanylate kinase [Synechocystis sp. IPPAS B-1465]MBD2619297.1 guanylate kinase [Synechocystis sp. FACHB-898]